MRVHAVALNPPDAFMLERMQASEIRMGSDFAGVVEEVYDQGSGRIKVGDRVCGMVRGNVDTESGAFAESVVTCSKLVVKLPDHIDYEHGATLGMSLWTAIQALFLKDLLLSFPGKTKEEPLLIWGGASAVGQFAIQLASLAGYHVLATSSRGHFAHLKSLGARQVFDYRSSQVSEDIRHGAPELVHCLDCVSTAGTMNQCIKSLNPKKNVILQVVLPPSSSFHNPSPARIQIAFALVHTGLGDPIPWASYLFDPVPTHEELERDCNKAAKWLGFDQGILYPLLSEGMIKPLPVTREAGVGLDAIPNAVKAMTSGSIRGKKLVVSKVASTR